MKGNKLRYESRLQRLIDYIYEHLNEPLDLMTMADVAGISQYHLHRIYSSIYGESISNMIKRLRLHKAAGNLINSSMGIDQVALLSGYRHLQSFTRAFSAEFGAPPASFRQKRRDLAGIKPLTLMTPHEVAKEKVTMQDAKNQTEFPVRITDLETPLGLVVYPHQGSYMNIGQAFEKLSGWAGMRQLFDQNTRMMAVYFHDPDTTPEQDLRSLAGISVSADKCPTLEAPLETYEVSRGKYAVLRFKGPYADMHRAYRWFFGDWLTQSGHEVADKPPFEEYLNDPRQVPPSELLTDIYMPLI
jgi:AraC family transcriptional regulator